MKYSYAFAGLCALLMSASTPAHALRLPRPIATDSRIQTVMYDPNEIYKFTGHYGYQSSIEFAADEEVQTVSLGDSLSWLITPSGNRIFLKPVEQDAMTNMTVITSKHIYHFELHPMESDNINDKSMIFVLRFVYPDDSGNINVGGSLESLPNPELEPEKYNFSYTVSGAENISPIKIFDDGQFTYFQFQDKNADVPAFFLVDRLGNESIINFRTRGDYIVVERVGSQFTLRSGNDVACVFNESRPQKREKSGGFFGRAETELKGGRK